LKATYSSVGLPLVTSGAVACLFLCGGQGTRLGYDGIKGAYTLPTSYDGSIFDEIVNRGIKLSRDIVWYVMTSPMNHDDTVAYFKNKNYYGLSEDSFRFFIQGVLPCLTPPTQALTSATPVHPTDYKIMLGTSSSIAFAPDGNGGIYNAVKASGMLNKMTADGVKYVHVFSVDNVLVKPADPAFVGFCEEQGADVGNKVLWKSNSGEKIGVMACDSQGRPCIIEYSDMAESDKTAVDSAGKLIYGAGNICNHFYTTEFLNDVLEGEGGKTIDDLVKFHVAQKKIPYYDAKSDTIVTPSANNGIKLETFIFDVFPLSKQFCVGEVVREEEFSPVKNATGADSPAVAIAMMSDRAKGWLRAAVEKHCEGEERQRALAIIDQAKAVEIEPGKSYEGEGFGRGDVDALLEAEEGGVVYLSK